MCAYIGNQQSRGVVIVRLRLSVLSFLYQRRDFYQSTYLYLLEDRETTSHHRERCRQKRRRRWSRIPVAEPMEGRAVQVRGGGYQRDEERHGHEEDNTRVTRSPYHVTGRTIGVLLNFFLA
jgi:hypothetical protein